MKKRKLLVKEQLEELVKAMKSAKLTREYRRYQALYLYGTGKEVSEIIEITQLRRETISKLYSKYNREGITSIPDAPRPGRPHRLSDEQEAAIKEMVLTKIPEDVGFNSNCNWTAGIIAEYVLREFGVRYSIKGITLMLARLNLSFTRPTYTLAKADPKKQEQFREDFTNIKKSCKWIKSNT